MRNKEKEIQGKIKKLKKMKLKGKMDWEVDYSKISYDFMDDQGDAFKPLLLVIVQPESYFVLKMHFVDPLKKDYLLNFLDELLNTLIESEFCPKRIIVKKQELFDLFSDVLKELNIELELAKRRMPAIEDVKREYAKFLKQRFDDYEDSIFTGGENKDYDDEESRLYGLYYDAMDLLSAGKIDESKLLLQGMLKNNPEFVDAYNGLVEIYEGKGDKEKAKECANLAFKKTKKHFPKWPNKMEWGILDNRKYLRAILNKAIHSHEDERYKEAERLYLLLLKINPSDNQGVRYFLAALFAGEYPRIIDELMEECNEKQDWSKIENFLDEQNKKHKFWKSSKY